MGFYSGVNTKPSSDQALSLLLFPIVLACWSSVSATFAWNHVPSIHCPFFCPWTLQILRKHRHPFRINNDSGTERVFWRIPTSPFIRSWKWTSRSHRGVPARAAKLQSQRLQCYPRRVGGSAAPRSSQGGLTEQTTSGFGFNSSETFSRRGSTSDQEVEGRLLSLFSLVLLLAPSILLCPARAAPSITP